MKKTAPDGLNLMIQAPCLLMRLRDYLKNKDKIRTKIRTKKTAPAGRTTRRMDFNPETLSLGQKTLILKLDCWPMGGTENAKLTPQTCTSCFCVPFGQLFEKTPGFS